MSLTRLVRATRFLNEVSRSLTLLQYNGWHLIRPVGAGLTCSVSVPRHFWHRAYCLKEADKSGKYESSSDDSSSSSDEDEVDPKLASAAEDAAKSLPGDADKTKSDLLSKLREHITLSQEQKHGKLPPSSLRSVVGGMKTVQKQRKKAAKDEAKKEMEPGMEELSGIEDYDQVTSQRRRRRGGEGRGRREAGSERERRAEGGEMEGRRQGRRFRKEQRLDDMDIFNSPPLGIFSVIRKMPDAAELEKTMSLYDRIQRDLELAEMTYPPQNAFEEWSRWTKEGKMWIYPVDNEQGMEEEANVGFHEHVFLDHMLEDFPKRGPVRHFMELVINGLSKNPYLTVSQKKEHIEWYKQYFSDKYKLIEELTITASSSKEAKQ